MTTKDEVIAAIEASDERLKKLSPALLAASNAKLPDSDWNVGEALSHVAARANAVPLSLGIMQRMLFASSQGQPANLRAANRIDDINQAQLDERQGRSVADLLKEIEAGHQAGISAVRALPPEQFDQRFPQVTGDGETSLGEMIQRAGSGHETAHLDEIERALPAV